MADQVRDIPLDDLVIGKGQVRTRVGEGIDELAESIRVMGLLEPIVVTPANKDGKYEILTGQRRFLAHKKLKKKTIMAVVRSEKVDEGLAKGISVTENVMRVDLTRRELIDACTALYKRYGSVKDVCDATGLPMSKVRDFVKYDRLVPSLKKLVDGGEVDLKAALRAQDAASVFGKVDEKEAVAFAKEMSGMSGVQQERIVKERVENPDTSADDLIESAKTGSKVTQVVVTLSTTVHSSLQSFAKSEGQNQDDAAATLIEEALQQKGF
jgi:ParB family transcriptional regulator, chromosome partitioning protein